MNLDLSAMRIFWINNGSTPSQEITSLLEKVERPLRHELTHLHLLNFIPQITFTQDMEHEKMLEIQRLIDQADKGEDDENPIVEMEGTHTLSDDIKVNKIHITTISFSSIPVKSLRFSVTVHYNVVGIGM